MPEPKVNRRSGGSVRFVKSPQPVSKPRSKAVTPKRAPARPSAARRRLERIALSDDQVPEWKDLERGNGRQLSRPEWGGAFAAIPTLKMAMMIVAAAAVITLYVGHVYATTQLLADVDVLRRENLELHLERNQVKGSFDRAAGPSVIAERARALGLQETAPVGTPITLARR